MSRLTTWIKNQNPSAVLGMTALKDVDCLHISTNPRLGKMTPRVGNRQTMSEDRTIPRISGAETIVGCIHGHSSVRQVSKDKQEFDGFDWVENKVPIYHIYRLNIEELVRPSKKLVEDAVRTRELWVVPYCPEACSVNPERMGQLLMKQTLDIVTGNKRLMKNTFVMKVDKPFKLEDDVLEIGCYQFELNGSLSLVSGGKMAVVEKLKSITTAEYLAVVKSYSGK